MASTTTPLQHPRHDQHPLEPRDFSKDSIPSRCDLCQREISADGYACQECKFYVHRLCAEAPPRIDPHPLHTDHPLTLIHRPPSSRLDGCDLCFNCNDSMFRCNECYFKLDIRCALTTLSDWGDTHGKTLQQINLPLHHHPLTSFSTRHDFMGDSICVICKANVERDGYACLQKWCEFLIHNSCIQDLYYMDGTKAPRIYHPHPLTTFLGEDTGLANCANCLSDESSGEFIRCTECRFFYCRDCVQVPESIQYPHHPDHSLVLLICSLDKDRPKCNSCLVSLETKLCYGCPFCEFFVDLSCALQVLAYSEEGMSTEIKLSWHKHQLHLCHGIGYMSGKCSYCDDTVTGPMYACKVEDCKIILHKRCTEIEVPEILQHPHHPDHPLTLCNKADYLSCNSCRGTIFGMYFSCELCEFYLHSKCATRFPTRKHPLHEHELLHLEKVPLCECNRCGTSTSSPFFRCVPCGFNLHEECMELPHVVNSKIHWHPLTLHETYIEDDSGEYYCDQCEKTRDIRLGAYVCLQCIQRWVYHIDCVLPELRKVFEKDNTIAIERMTDEITLREEKVREAERMPDEMKRVVPRFQQRGRRPARLRAGAFSPSLACFGHVIKRLVSKGVSTKRELEEKRTKRTTLIIE